MKCQVCGLKRQKFEIENNTPFEIYLKPLDKVTNKEKHLIFHKASEDYLCNMCWVMSSEHMIRMYSKDIFDRIKNHG